MIAYILIFGAGYVLGDIATGYFVRRRLRQGFLALGCSVWAAKRLAQGVLDGDVDPWGESRRALAKKVERLTRELEEARKNR